MPRKPLDIGTYGKIATKKQVNGRWRATARVRDHDGETRTVQAFGKSQNDAETRLKRSIRDRVAMSGDEINRDMKIESLADLWLDEIVNGN